MKSMFKFQEHVLTKSRNKILTDFAADVFGKFVSTKIIGFVKAKIKKKFGFR